ncbi:hypothetical protein GCM10010198_18140 [Nocardia seriolae]
MTAFADQTCAALATVSGCDLQVPLVQGGTIGYANFDYAASAPALQQVTDRIAELLPFYAAACTAAPATPPGSPPTATSRPAARSPAS